MNPLRALPWLLAAGLAQAQPGPSAPPPSPAAPAAPATLAAPAPAAPAARPAPPAAPEPGRLYAPGSFDRLELSGAARVTLVQGERDQAFVVGDTDAQKSVDVDLVDRLLIIRPAGGWKFWHSNKPQVQVEVRELRQLIISGASDLLAPGPLRADQLKLNISGAGNVRLDQLQVRQLVFAISGSGDGQLGGRVDDMALQISGKGKVVADRMQTKTARVSVSGLGNVVLWVTDDLNAHISGIGSVDYFGNPSVQRSVSGMGNITARGEKKASVDSR